MMERSGQSGKIVIGGMYEAEFWPRETSDLKLRASEFIGKKGVFEALWKIEEGEAYAGDFAMRIPRSWAMEDVLWAPSSDLRFLWR